MKGKNLFALLLAAFGQLFCIAVFAAAPSLIPLVGNYYKNPELSQLQEALDAGADVNELGAIGMTPLIEAVNRNRPNSVKFLLENGADPNKLSAKGVSPLAYAAMQHFTEVARLLIEAGADVHEVGRGGDSILNHADLNFKDNFDLIDLLVEKGVRSKLIDPENDPNKKDANGDTLLFKAVKEQEESAVAYLLRQGADPNLKTDKGMTPLYAAVGLEFGSSILMVRRLVAAGADVNEPISGGWAPLHKAATKADTDVMSFLLEHGAELEAQSVASMTPLMCVEENARNGVLLLDAGARVKVVDKTGRTPLHFAAKKNNINFAFFLVEAGAEINARDVSGKTPLLSAFEERWYQQRLLGFLDFMLDKGADINAVASDGKSLLQIAESHHNHEIIGFLLERGAVCDIVATDSGEIATQTLIFKAQETGREGLACCFALTLKPIKTPLLINDAGETLLHLAVRGCNSDLVKILLKNGFSPNFQRKDGKTPLHLAVSSNSEDSIVALLKAGADPKLADAKKVTPADQARRFGGGVVYQLMRHFNPEDANEELETSLLDAAKSNHPALTLAALENRPQLEEKDENGLTPLFYTIKNSWHLISKRLLKMGASADIADKRGVTPLHLAAAEGDRVLVKELLQRNARIDAFDEEGQTALFYAVQKNQTHIAELLLAHGANLHHVDKRGRNALFYCYMKDPELATIAWLVKKGLPINSVDKDGHTVFHEMMNPLRRLSQIKKALKLGADWHIADKKGETPFAIALYGYSEELQNYVFTLDTEIARAKTQMNLVMHRWLVSKSYDLMKKAFAAGISTELLNKKGKTLLVEALRKDYLEAATMLVKAGADLGPVVIEAKELVMNAIEYRKIDKLKWLFDHHVDLNLQTEDGGWFLWQTVGKWEIFDFLWNHGAQRPVSELFEEKMAKVRLQMLSSKDGRDRLQKMAGPELKNLVFAGKNDVERYQAVRDFIHAGDLDGLKFAYKLGFDVNSKVFKGRSLLHTAVLYKKLPVVKQLLEWGADINVKNDAEMTPLHWAIDYNAKETALYLIESGAALDGKGKFNGAGLLHFAAENSAPTEVFEMLLKRGFAVNDRDDNGATPLLFAVENAKDETVEFLLQAGADVNIATEVGSSALRTNTLQKGDYYFYRTDIHISNWIISGVTPLARAALHGKTKILEMLIEKGARLDVADELGNTPLHSAVIGNSSFGVDILLKAGAPILVTNKDGLTPLELAEKSSLWPIARDIWQKVPLHITHDPTDLVTTQDNRHSLHAAVKDGKMHDLRWIVRRGADVNGLDDEGHSPLWWAVEKGGNTRMIKLLLELEASPNVAGPDGESPWLRAFIRTFLYEAPALLLAAGAKIDSADKNGDTALHLAARKADLKNIELLLRHKATLTVRNQSGLTPLMEAVLAKDRQDMHEEKMEKIKGFVQRQKKAYKKLPPWQRPKLPKIEENSDERRAVMMLITKDRPYLNLADIYGQTALHLAARKVASFLIADLVEAGCELEIPDREGRTPIFHAIATGNIENVETLLKLGAKALATDKNSETTLSLADSLGHDEIVEILVKAGAARAFIVPEWPEVDEKGKTRLMRAVSENRFGAVKQLIESGAELNTADPGGETSLFYAVRGCNYKMVEFLLKNGADRNLKNVYEQNAVEFARQRSRETGWRDNLKAPPGIFPEQKKYEDWQRIIKLLEEKK